MYRFHLIRFRRPSRKVARISEEDLVKLSASGATVIDVRTGTEFAAGHFAGSLNLCLEGRSFASCAELFMPKESEIILVAGKPQEAHRAGSELRRAGYSRVGGFIVAADLTGTDQLTRLSAFDLKSTLSRGRKPAILDVRPVSAWRSTRIPGSKNIPLVQLFARTGELCSSSPLVVLCEDGYESALAASWLQSNGFDSVQHLIGGMRAYAGGGVSEYPDALQAASSLGYGSAAIGV
jgi:hydroxyacylglutathione hydrolase